MQDKRNSKIEKGKLLMNRIMRPLSDPVETTWREVIDGLVPLQTQLIGYYESLGYRNLAGTGLIEDVRALTLATCKDDIANSIAFLLCRIRSPCMDFEFNAALCYNLHHIKTWACFLLPYFFTTTVTVEEFLSLLMLRD